MPKSAALRVLITAGPTHEHIDAVRYIGNRSSGRMGLALAEASARRGWSTTLLLGPTQIPPPDTSQVRTIRFQTAADLERLLAGQWPSHDLLLMAAAVADFRPAGHQTGTDKIKRSSGKVTLELEPTPDLLAGLAQGRRPDQAIIGFALEPQDRLLSSAREKLASKRLDAIVANPLETMDADRVTATLLLANGELVSPAPGLAKADFAEWLLSTVAPLPALRR